MIKQGFEKAAIFMLLIILSVGCITEILRICNGIFICELPSSGATVPLSLRRESNTRNMLPGGKILEVQYIDRESDIVLPASAFVGAEIVTAPFVFEEDTTLSIIAYLHDDTFSLALSISPYCYPSGKGTYFYTEDGELVCHNCGKVLSRSVLLGNNWGWAVLCRPWLFSEDDYLVVDDNLEEDATIVVRGDKILEFLGNQVLRERQLNFLA